MNIFPRRRPSAATKPAALITDDDLAKLRQESIDAQMTLTLREAELRTRHQQLTEAKCRADDLELQLAAALKTIELMQDRAQASEDRVYRQVWRQVADSQPGSLLAENAQLRRNAAQFENRLAVAEGRPEIRVRGGVR